MTFDTALVAAFWIGLCGTLYAYAGFPALATWLASLRRSTDAGAAATEPSTLVTIVIPGVNEEHGIAAKIRNVLEADYPRSLLDVLVVSDASTDRTNEVAAGLAGDGVRIIIQETRCGKTAGLNRALGMARGDIIVFTDANAAYSPGTIRVLVDYFRDPRVGLITGYTRYTTTEGGDVADTTNAYTSLERTIKAAESQWGCCVGADGAIFAMRRSLFRPLRDDDINDFVLPLERDRSGVSVRAGRRRVLHRAAGRVGGERISPAVSHHQSHAASTVAPCASVESAAIPGVLLFPLFSQDRSVLVPLFLMGYLAHRCRACCFWRLLLASRRRAARRWSGGLHGQSQVAS